MTDANKKGADDNIYKESFEKVTLSEEKRQEILRIPKADAADAKGSGRGVSARKRFSTVMISALILVLVTGTAVAVSSGGSLKDWFEREWRSSNGKEMSTEQLGVIDSLTTPLGISQTVGEVTATLDSVTYSDGIFWALVNVKGVQFDAKQSNSFKNFTLKAYGKSGTQLEDSWSMTSQTTEDGEIMQVLICGDLDSALLKKEKDRNVRFEFIFSDLTENPFKADKSRILQAGEWKFDFELTQETTGETLTAKSCEIRTRDSSGQRVSCTVSELELNTVNIRYHIKPGENCTDESVHLELPRVLLKSGYDVKISEVGICGGSSTQAKDGCWEMEYQLSMPINLDDVKAVKIGETEITLTTAK